MVLLVKEWVCVEGVKPRMYKMGTILPLLPLYFGSLTFYKSYCNLLFYILRISSYLSQYILIYWEGTQRRPTVTPYTFLDLLDSLFGPIL